MSGSETAQSAPLPEPAPTLAQGSILLNFLPHALETFRREPALAITLCYALVAMAGIFYNYNFYRRFDIPVLTLSQIGDFLVAGLQQPIAILLVLSTFPLCWIADRVNAHKRRRRSARRVEVLRGAPDSAWRRARLLALSSPPRWMTGCLYVALVIVYAWIFVHFYAHLRADQVRQGDAPQVTVWQAGAGEPLRSQAANWTYLGAVANYVFLYDAAADRSVVLPVNSISRIQPVTLGRAPASD